MNKIFLFSFYLLMLGLNPRAYGISDYVKTWEVENAEEVCARWGFQEFPDACYMSQSNAVTVCQTRGGLPVLRELMAESSLIDIYDTKFPTQTLANQEALEEFTEMTKRRGFKFVVTQTNEGLLKTEFFYDSTRYNQSPNINREMQVWSSTTFQRVPLGTQTSAYVFESRRGTMFSKENLKAYNSILTRCRH